jgi:hypothetical protein
MPVLVSTAEVSRRTAVSVLLSLTGAVTLGGAAVTVPGPLAEPFPGDRAEPAIVRGEFTTVVGHRGSEPFLAEIAEVADAASTAVREVWGAAPGMIVVPADGAQAARVAGSGPLTGFAAVATADRVVVVPGGFARLSATGRRVVLAHELTHVATGAARTTHLPMWLVEGFADYVGYRDAGLPAPVVAAELAAEVRAGSVPERLPARPEFRAGAVRLAQAYEEAWLACRYVVARFGEKSLVRLYRDALRGDIVAALGALGLTAAELTSAWRSYLREELH